MNPSSYCVVSTKHCINIYESFSPYLNFSPYVYPGRVSYQDTRFNKIFSKFFLISPLNIMKLLKENQNLVVRWSDMIISYHLGEESKPFLNLNSADDFIDGFEI